jgi:exodeoxyribonuclease-3
VPLTVVTANVNGIRAAARRGGLDWLARAGADAILLQEVRATHAQLHEALSGTPLAGWHVAHSPSASLGRAGVAVLTRVEPLAVREGLGSAEFDGQGRWLEVDVPAPAAAAPAAGRLTLASVYVHTGEAETERQDEKHRFLAAVGERLAVLGRRAARGRGEALVGGDLNVAHRQADLKNWKGNRGKAGYLPSEQAYLDTWLGPLRWTDLGRAHAGDVDGPYTWWSWRGQAFDTDTGWRIDYLLATPRLAARLADVAVGRAPSYAERWSDHAPVTARFR